MLTRMLFKAVEANPARTAIVQGGRRVRYDELHALTGRCAAGLRRLGIGAGDCVAVVLPNCPEFVASLFACATLRAVMLPLNPQFTTEELLRFVADARAKVLVADSTKAGLFAGASALVADFESLLSLPAEPMPSAPFSGPVLYLYTSGSTDTRKRLCCTQENLFYEALNFIETVGLTAADNILCTIPLYHSYGIGNCLLDAVYAGSTLVLLESEEAPFAAHCRRVLELIRAEAIRFYPGVPYQFQMLSALPDHPPPDLAGLNLCVSSGDVLPRRTYERFLERFGLPIRSLYGSTIAALGMGCRFPGAENPAQFWQTLLSGRDAITEIPPDRWDVEVYYDANPQTPGKSYSRWGGFLDRVDEFDAAFFGISAREAQQMDPRQRILLETAWLALKNAAQDSERLSGSNTGVFVGHMVGDYYSLQTKNAAGIDSYCSTGNLDSIYRHRGGRHDRV
jgi:acyl-CoA synthetase (AMP-forming)/AMP-acid ligase II